MKRSLFPAVMVLVVLSFCALSYTTSAFALPVRGDLQNTGNFQIKTLPQGVFAWKLETGSNITGAPIVDGNTVYVGNHKGRYMHSILIMAVQDGNFNAMDPSLVRAAADKDKVYVELLPEGYMPKRSSGLPHGALKLTVRSWLGLSNWRYCVCWVQ